MESTDHKSIYGPRQCSNMILLAIVFAVYFGFRAGCLVVLPLASKELLHEALDGAEYSPLYQLPLTLWFIMDIIVAVPNAFFMRRFGRRAGFLTGVALAFFMSILAFLTLRFVKNGVLGYLLLIVCVLFMSIIGMAEYVKYAASEACFNESMRPRFVSWVITGGALLGAVGPLSATACQYLGNGNLIHGFAHFFLFMAALAFIGIVACFYMKLPPIAQAAPGEQTEPLLKIFARIPVWTSVLAIVAVQFVMALPMSSCPLAMVDYLKLKDSSYLISGVVIAHTASMFLLGLGTGDVIKCVGKLPVMAVGALLLVACSASTISQFHVTNFYIGLVLLGMGWNFAFVSGTLLMMASHKPEERTQVTAATETLRFLANAIASILSSSLQWNVLCVLCVCIIALGAFTVGSGDFAGRRVAKAELLNQV